MLHEKPDEIYQWKNKLAGLDQLPGEEIPDKSRLWEKLHDRLSQKPARKVKQAYWAAAACVLITVGLTAIILHQQQDGMAKLKTKQIHTLTTKPNPAPLTKSAHTPMTLAGKKPLSKGIVKNQIHHSRAQTITPIVAEALTMETTQKTPDAALFAAPAFADTPHLAATAPAKKKLRVVHINELGLPLEDEADPSPRNATAAYQLKPFNQHVSRNLEFSTNVSDDLVKIKLSPSN